MLITVLTIWFTSDHSEEGTLDSQEVIQQMALNKVLAKDLSLTTSMFVTQLKNQLIQWGNVDATDDELHHEFLQELNNHEHFEGFVLVEDGEIKKSAGELTKEDLTKLIHSFDGLSSSDPYLKDGSEHMLISCKRDNRVIVGEINLSFVKEYMKDLAHVADANGNYFIGGASTDLEIQEPSSVISSSEITEMVDELGWKIVVDSNGKDEQSEERHHEAHEAVIRFAEGIDGKQWVDRLELQLVKNGDPYYVVRDETRSAEQLVVDLESFEEIETAELNYYYAKQQNFDFFSHYRQRTLQPND